MQMALGTAGFWRRAQFGPSKIGLEEFVRVRLEETAGHSYAAYPVFGKSGMLSTMVKAEGIITIPMNAEGFSKGDLVQVIQL